MNISLLCRCPLKYKLCVVARICGSDIPEPGAIELAHISPLGSPRSVAPSSVLMSWSSVILISYIGRDRVFDVQSI